MSTASQDLEQGQRTQTGEAIPLLVPEDRWDASAAGPMSEAERLRYRSNLLGEDLAVTNFGGGNTSAKIEQEDPVTGQVATVLWVKGSGGDLGSMGLDGFATLYLERLRSLEGRYPGLTEEDGMVPLLRHCVFAANPRPPSIDTPLHTFLPYAHIDHTHPDAVIAIAASDKSQDLTREIFGPDIGWLPWQRPGFDLGLRLRDYDRAHPGLKGIVLEGHGLFTWAETSRDCYALTVEIIAKAARAVNGRLADQPAFGGPRVATRSDTERRRLASRIMMDVRPLISQDRPKVGHFADTPEILEFVGSVQMERLARMGTSCPDHFLRTKILPLIVDPEEWTERGVADLDAAFARYREDYTAYYNRHADDASPPLRDANPVIYLIPGVGLASFAADKATARIASEFYQNAINVMRGAEALNGYQGLDEREAFNIEYWQLEEDKLRRRPAPKPFAGRIAVITGGAGGIGLACGRRLLSEGACVMLADIDGARLTDAKASLVSEFGVDRIRNCICDVTNETDIVRLVQETGLAFGGVDIAVANAGLASAAPVEETSLELFRKNHSVLVDGYFLLARECFRHMKGSGGSIVFVGSKNGLVASKNASAYASAKAAELHLARCLALEGAEHGIRVNSVNPDAVLRGSNIWTGNWRKERADAYDLESGDLEEHYRKRSLLGRSVFPEDVAEAVAFFAGDLSAKSTGNILNVDAGHAGAFTR